MATFNIKFNMRAYRPMRWTHHYVKTYGQANEGFTVEACDVEEVKSMLRDKLNLNPEYHIITEKG